VLWPECATHSVALSPVVYLGVLVPIGGLGGGKGAMCMFTVHWTVLAGTFVLPMMPPLAATAHLPQAWQIGVKVDDEWHGSGCGAGMNACILVCLATCLCLWHGVWPAGALQ
jgi:hypothetical protein